MSTCMNRIKIPPTAYQRTPPHVQGMGSPHMGWGPPYMGWGLTPPPGMSTD